MLLQVGNVLNVPLEQAEDVIHSTKQPGQENKAQNQLNVIQSPVRIYQIIKELSGSIMIQDKYECVAMHFFPCQNDLI